MLTKHQFLDELADILSVPTDLLQADSELHAFEMWDSMAKLSLLTVIDNNLLGPLAPGLLDNLRTVDDLVKSLKLQNDK